MSATSPSICAMRSSPKNETRQARCMTTWTGYADGVASVIARPSPDDAPVIQPHRYDFLFRRPVQSPQAVGGPLRARSQRSGRHALRGDLPARFGMMT